jgi:hypothetical protein
MAETVRCAQCGGQSPTDAQFCIECGKPIANPATGPTTRLAGVACPNCGTNNPENARFCVVCGRTLTAAPNPQPRPAPARPAPPRPTPMRPAPHQSYPRVDTTPPFIPARPMTPPARRSRAGGPNVGVLVFLFGLLFLASSRFLWPGILLLIGIVFLIDQSMRGRADKAIIGLLWLGGLTILFATGTFWPGILILWLLSMVFGGWGHGRPWHC